MLLYWQAFGITWCTESVVVFLLLRKAGWRRILWVELILNLTTHPLLWFGLLRLPGHYIPNLFLTEFLVAAVEASLALPLYRGAGSRVRIIAAVLGANAVTFLMTFLF